MNFIPTSTRIGIALIPPKLSDGVLNDDEVAVLDAFCDLPELSSILSDQDVAFYLWYNTKMADLVPGFVNHSDFIPILLEPRVQGWIVEHQTVYDKVVLESEAKYSIAKGGSKRALSVDYGNGCYYTPILSSGVLYLVGTETDPYLGKAYHFFDAALAQMSKSVRISDLARYDIFDMFVKADPQ